jgi:soluble cytochrome b562
MHVVVAQLAMMLCINSAELCTTFIRILPLYPSTADRSDETCKATGDRRQMQQQLSEMQRQLEEASEGAYDITRDMTRQYKGMQEELLNRINQLEGSIQVCDKSYIYASCASNNEVHRTPFV